MPEFGTVVLYLVMAASAYTFAVALAAARSKPRLLGAARLGAYAVVALVALDVLVLAYCFVTHDFRVKYVHRYSDRTMPLGYVLSALWGGQDGSLLFWTFILGAYTTACVRWLKGRYLQLQPWIIATLMVVFLFFGLLMVFAANPFETYWSGAPPDGRGLNPQLQNFYMIIHPPSLYLGFVGFAIPFAFAVAALLSGRLGEEWIHAIRSWTLFAWLFLSIGNLLGAIWAYEELGWGGYWAWDPVENAGWMPWITSTALLHSVMIQERRGMLKVWNLFLVVATFALTIFGTFLTRSGVISSVHSFAQSGIGPFFVWFLVLMLGASAALVVWRLPLLRARAGLDSVLSREAAFTFNNWILLSALLVVFVLTTFPLLSEWAAGEKVTVGPTFFTFFMIPVALTLVFLTGIGMIIPWRKGATRGFLMALRWPTAFAVVVAALFAVFGGRLGFSPFVEVLPDVIEGVRAEWLRAVLRVVYGTVPTGVVLVNAFGLAVVVQEFHRGGRLRHRDHKESWPVAIYNLVWNNRRRYGGYVVHVGVFLMMFGFLGGIYGVEREGALRPGQKLRVWDYEVTYRDTKFDVDPAKRTMTAYLDVTKKGRAIGTLRPARWIYRSHPDSPTTEVAIRSSLRDDLYAVLANVDPGEGTAMIKLYLNPLVTWIWIGGVVLVFGTFITLLPVLARERARARRTVLVEGRKAAATGTAAAIALAILASPLEASAQHEMSGATSPLPAGGIELRNDVERRLFPRLICMCGGCPRLPLSTCTCQWAENARTAIRARLAEGDAPDRILDDYRSRHGAAAIAIPSSTGFGRLAWIGPYLGVGIGMLGLGWLVRRWVRKAREVARRADEASPSKPLSESDRSEYEETLDAELRRMDV